MANDIAQDLLDEQRVDYTPKMVAVADIDRKASRDNLARVDVDIDSDTVDRYAIAMLDGDEFPPIIVQKKPSGWFVLDGNHRVAAAVEAEIDEMSALVVDVDEETARRIIAVANIKHGLPLSHEERLLHAERLHVHQEMPVKQAAALLRVSRSTLSGSIRRRKAAVRAAELGIAGFDRMPAMAQGALGTIKPNRVFAEAARTAINLKMTGKDVHRFATKVKEALTEGEDAALEAARTPDVGSDTTEGEPSGRKHIRTAHHRCMMASKNLMGVSEQDIASSVSVLGSSEKADLAKLFRMTATRLSMFADVIDG